MNNLSGIVIISMVLAAGLLPRSEALDYIARYSRYTAIYYYSNGNWFVCYRCTVYYYYSSSPSLPSTAKKRSAETVMDMIDMADKEKENLEEQFSLDSFFQAADTDCDGYLDSCEWNKLDSGVREFMGVLGRVNSTDELLSLEELKQLDYTLEVKMQMQMPMDDLKMMMGDMDGQDEGSDGGDDGPKDRKRPDGGNP